LLGSGLLSPNNLESFIALAFGGVGVIICGLVRDAGRRLQDSLWKSWGGGPATQRLRWRGNEASVVQRRHDRVQGAIGDKLPSAESEGSDPDAAEREYDDAIATLRELTRDQKRFPLVFEENVNYGFRRNCLGIRPIALGIAGLVTTVSSVLAVAGGFEGRYLVSLLVGLVALIGWLRMIDSDWVRQAAELYADRLHESTETLRRDSPTRPHA
jgi:hypothetical protein